jgi:ubiquinol-cytochrome c reductase cytochrome b subunit
MASVEESEQKSKEPIGASRMGWARSLAAWVDERSGFSHPLRKFFLYPVPVYVHKNILYSLGGLTFITIMLQMASGVLLTFYYDPSPAEAYNSVDYVTYQLPTGSLVRGIHVYNTSVIIVLVSLHMLRTFLFSAYKKPREITWLSGLAMFLIVLGLAFTGDLLPWDQSGYWATKVGTEIAASVPLVGGWIAQLLRGGPILGQGTLSRFFVLHVLLFPSILLALIGLHIHQLRFHGVAPPITARGKALAQKFVPFFPHWMTVDAVLGLVLLTALIFTTWIRHVNLEFPADPTSADYTPRPEWYFLFLFQSLKYFPGSLEPVAAFLIPILIVGGLVLLPFLDRGEERRPWRKPVTSILAIVFILLIVALTLFAILSDR